ncbi:hypothetical protein GJAV_G00206660 [Gymnothorax javanicus]|nr:hypothetical protein GJAV_G00206660 [Gymnothorax javanicus]
MRVFRILEISYDCNGDVVGSQVSNLADSFILQGTTHDSCCTMDAHPRTAFSKNGLLNHNGDILSSQFTHGRAVAGESQRGPELCVTRMSFHGETRAFSAKNEGMTVISKSTSTSVEIVECSSVVDVKVGLTVPCILLRQRKKQGTHFKYLLLTLSHSNSLNLHMEFKLPYEIKDHLTLLRGPTVLWSNAGIIYYTSLKVGGVKQVSFRPSSFIFTGELPLDKRKIIILGSQISTKENTVTEDIWGQRSLGYFLDEGKEFDGACILPHAYCSVVKCMLLISAEEEQEGLRSEVMAATSTKQLVWFQSGVPRDVCVLPFEDPQNILLVDTGRNGCFFAISFSHGNVCAVWKDTFQVASCWQGVTSLLVDDFVGCGTEQALLLCDGPYPPGVVPTDFIITDLGDITYTSRPESSEGPHGAEAVQENHLLTVQALESRLQSGMASVQELQRDLEEKNRVIRRSVRALMHLVSGRPFALPSAQQEGLVSLWDDGDEEDSSVELPSSPLAPPNPVVKVWHRVLEDQLVVGVQLGTDAAGYLDSASVSFLIDVDRSRTPPRKKPDWSGETGLTLTVTAVTQLAPLLAHASCPLRVLLHLPTAPESSGAPQSPGAPQVLHCGFITLDIQDVAQGKLAPHLLKDPRLSTAEASEDLLSILAAFDSWCFQIGCSDHTLFDVPRWLLGAQRGQRVAVRQDFIVSAMEHLPSVMLFEWQEKSPFRGELTVHCRGLHNLLQFLDSLCRVLPPSHRVQLLGRDRAEQDPGQAFATALEREVLALREGVTSVLHSAVSEEESERVEQVERSTGSVPEGPAEELHRRRAEWGRERERSRSRLLPLVDGERYRRLVLSLSHVQLQTDLAALALCDSWPLPTGPGPDSSIPAAPNASSR